MRVGWLGLGAMGAPMATRLARCGHSVHGYDIASDRAAALAADGVRSADSAAAAAGRADAVVIMVATPDQPVTAAAVLSLIDDGLLELNGPVDELLPELAGRRVLRSPDGPLDQTVPARRPVTVRDPRAG